MINILIVDAQGGGIGKQLIEAIQKENIAAEIVAVGTNSMATGKMLKAGAVHAATGENPVVVGCRNADIIMGPIGIVIADAMYGEITPKMAVAVGQSKASKILIPINHCSNYIAGVNDISMKGLIESAIQQLKAII